MRDPIRDLENFRPEGTPVDPMPASEVRRRGDRLRRRNNALATVGGVAAALAAVAVPLSVVNGDEPGRELQPAPPATEWRQEVPDEFPLDAGLTGEVRSRSGARPLEQCAPDTWALATAVDRADVSVGDGVEGFAGRTLAVYTDPDAASAALARVERTISTCADDPAGALRYVVGPEDVGGSEAETLVVVEQAELDEGSFSDLTFTRLSRDGNAVLVDQAYTSAGGASVIDQVSRNLLERSALTRASLCVFDANPCDLETVLADEELAGSAAGAIPDGFPLLAGYPTTSEGPGTGPVAPTRDLAPLQPEPCGSGAAVGSHTDLLRAGWSGPEDTRERQLVTFETEQQAEEYLRSVLAVFEECLEVTEGDFTRLTQVVTDVSGVGDSTGGAITRYEMDGAPVPGLETLVVVRVDNAVLLSTAATEGGAGPNPAGEVQDSFNRVLDQAAPVIGAMQDL